jgi:hypothetical protein
VQGNERPLGKGVTRAAHFAVFIDRHERTLLAFPYRITEQGYFNGTGSLPDAYSAAVTAHLGG